MSECGDAAKAFRAAVAAGGRTCGVLGAAVAGRTLMREDMHPVGAVGAGEVYGRHAVVAFCQTSG